MSPTAWSLILDELFAMSPDHNKLAEYVNNSTKSSYRKIYKGNDNIVDITISFTQKDFLL